MKLVVGLGNPGSEYRETRHNVGFLVADEIVRRWRLSDAWREKCEALHVRTTVGDEAVIVAKPLTFMNLSGQAVAGLAAFYKIDPVDVLVVTDDVALPLGRLRARPEGGAGGHNGLKSIIQHLGTQAFPRVRVGVGRGDDRRVTRGHAAHFRARPRGTDAGRATQRETEFHDGCEGRVCECGGDLDHARHAGER